MAPGTDARISLERISKRFGGVPALDDVSVDLHPGERLALVGENGAGKSTLMNVLFGLYQPDAGTVSFDGQPVALRTPAQAIRRGVGMVHQHFTLVPTLTVAENVVLGAEPRRLGFLLDVERACAAVEATCRRLAFQLDVRARVGSLSVGAQQRVEIIKALHRGARTLILDEPTAVLTRQEAQELFALLDALSREGVTIVLITHRLDDVLRFATRVVVLRRGRLVLQSPAAQTSAALLAAAMVGESSPAPAGAPPGEVASPPASATRPAPLELQHVSAPGLNDVGLTVRAGEILGVAGVDGNGQRELARLVTGLHPWTTGTVRLGGQAVDALTPARARALGVAHIPEDRLREAVVGDFSAEENLALGRQRSAPFARRGLIDFAGRRAHARALLEQSDVRPARPTARTGSLSGGNQQKLVVARELDSAPALLVAVQPTRGLDFGAVAAVHRRLVAHARAGGGVLLVSLDLDELLSVAHRLVVLHRGRVAGDFLAGQADAAQVGRAMLGVSPG